MADAAITASQVQENLANHFYTNIYPAFRKKPLETIFGLATLHISLERLAPQVAATPGANSTNWLQILIQLAMAAFANNPILYNLLTMLLTLFPVGG